MSELETQMKECGVCHALHPMADLVCFDDTLVCPECMEDTTTTCGRCGERMWREDDVGNEDSGRKRSTPVTRGLGRLLIGNICAK